MTKIIEDAKNSSISEVLLTYMRTYEGRDVKIVEMWRVLNALTPAASRYAPREHSLGFDTSYTQKYVGGYVSRLNKRLKKHRIVPGVARQTYRLINKI